MTVTLYHLCQVRACVRTYVHACVCGGGFLDISSAGVQLKPLPLFIYKPSLKSILFISDTGRSSSVGCV